VLSWRGTVLASGAVASAVAGLAYGVEEFLLLALAMAVLLTTGAVVVRRRQRVARRSLHLVVRVPTAEVTAGQPAVVEMRMANTGTRRLPPLLVEEPHRRWSVSHPGMGGRPAPGAPQPADHRSRARVSAGPSDPAPTRGVRSRARERRALARSLRLPELPAGAGTGLRTPVPTGRRGVLTLSDVGVWCEDPFRLIVRRVALTPPAHVVVYPVPVDSDRPVTPGHRTSHRERRSSVATRRLSGDELSGLRPYAPGDRLTRLHWPALARSGDLMVREFVEPELASLTLLVDVRPSVHAGDSLESTVSRAAALGITSLEQGVTVELCTSVGDRVVVAPDVAGKQTLLRALAMVGPSNPAPAVVRRWGGRPTGGAVWATRDRPDTDLVLVTTEAGSARPALPESLQRRADTVVVP